ncbi:hypothetical protein WOLCODRAFT_149665 [Wolfiporia cocos MD-104 SS10]|uniref:RNA 3'-terminal phosphate cyclase domain-containing protein n=1 Tax=Wolfiporia cocos (strain MD-104) TaxID=742152 RepID=A0A2H3JRU2_WOLCO|nr:hypothetical protein WOLCODRAFT_149665 [Wolfiporia cocos MD-104 SS10]
MAQRESVIVDGDELSELDGNSQYLYVFVLAALSNRRVEACNIRGGLGLQECDIPGLETVAKICKGQLIGCTPGSTNASLHPKRISLFPSYTIPFRSRPVISTTTTLQGLLPCLLFSSNNPSSSLSTGDPIHVQLRGATSAAGIPQIEYIKHVYLPFLERHFALRPDMRVHTLGFIPRGGGDVRASITPRPGPLQPIMLTRRGAVTSVAGRAYAAGLPAKFAREMNPK